MTPDDVVLAAHAWPTNAALIADVAKLGYLDGLVCDPTYGLGKWWTDFAPERLIAHDLNPEKSPNGDPVDFRDTRHPDATFDAVAFDPPYVCPGGRKTSTTKEMHSRYGMDGTDFRTPAELQDIINAGIRECSRIVRDRGYVLVKCKDYVWSGKLWPGTTLCEAHASVCDLVLVDRFEHIGTPGPQPAHKRQVHARRNLTTLLVFQRSRRKSDGQRGLF